MIISSTGPSGAIGKGGEGFGTTKLEDPVKRPNNDVLETEEAEEDVPLVWVLMLELCRLAVEDLCDTEGVAAGVAAGVL